jgi:hypothetical protein
MRATGRFVACILLTLSTRAFAHHDDHELGHHWSIPEYAGEIRLQVAAMAGLALLAGILLVVLRVIDSRKRSGAR